MEFTRIICQAVSWQDYQRCCEFSEELSRSSASKEPDHAVNAVLSLFPVGILRLHQIISLSLPYKVQSSGKTCTVQFILTDTAPRTCGVINVASTSLIVLPCLESSSSDVSLSPGEKTPPPSIMMLQEDLGTDDDEESVPSDMDPLATPPRADRSLLQAIEPGFLQMIAPTGSRRRYEESSEIHISCLEEYLIREATTVDWCQVSKSIEHIHKQRELGQAALFPLFGSEATLRWLHLHDGACIEMSLMVGEQEDSSNVVPNREEEVEPSAFLFQIHLIDLPSTPSQHHCSISDSRQLYADNIIFNYLLHHGQKVFSQKAKSKERDLANPTSLVALPQVMIKELHEGVPVPSIAQRITLEPITLHDHCSVDITPSIRQYLSSCQSISQKVFVVGMLLIVKRGAKNGLQTGTEEAAGIQLVESIDQQAAVCYHSVKDVQPYYSHLGHVICRVKEVQSGDNNGFDGFPKMALFDSSSTELVLKEQPKALYLPKFYRYSLSAFSSFSPLGHARSVDAVSYRVIPHLTSWHAVLHMLSISKERQKEGHSSLSILQGSESNWVMESSYLALEALGCAYIVMDCRSISFKSTGNDSENNEIVSLIRLNSQASNVVILRHAEQLSLQGYLSAWLQAPTGLKSSSSSGFHVLLVFEDTALQIPPLFASHVVAAPVILHTPKDADRKCIIKEVLQDICSPVTSSSSRSCSGIPHNCSSLLHQSFTVQESQLVSWTVGFTCSDILQWLLSAKYKAIEKATPNDICSQEGKVSAKLEGRPVLDADTLETVLKSFQQSHGQTVTSSKLQPVRWSDIGALEAPKKEVLETIQLPVLHPELFKDVKHRTGILLYGPPGCGKTLLAKAVATELGLNFISVKGPELINMYVGESEKNIRNLFQRARDCSPCIVFFDELDALAPSRGSKGDSGGVMDRIVAQLLAEVDGVSKAPSGEGQEGNSMDGSVFIIGATNRPDLLDPSLMRPGRFDRLCYLAAPSSKKDQLATLQALVRKFNLAPDVDLEPVIDPLSFGFTGADFFALSSDAMMFAVDEVVDKLKQEAREAPNTTSADESSESSIAITVTQEHFIRARDQLAPSVSEKDLKRYEALKQQFAMKQS